ncbi:glycosyltransferase family 8 protein [Nocardiopsis tropica]|uniref:Glycosyltransferase family 8 protein n=1 Tax=Nocardiopsis tropica TaxID=109330 RepID=A0ABU7KMX8_9ACTN|nr:glycosyltransferase family 8 protein [Nocardiopsis umidischolae]MEE2050655.1 glycosyltransferase family 8 protein [Nocardiopsis umidischolae]
MSENQPQVLPALAPIVCGVDDGYTEPLCTMVTSLAAAHPAGLAGLRMVVLHHRLSAASAARIEACAHRVGLAVRLCEVGDFNGPVTGWVSSAVYLRLAIDQVLGDEPVVLYLDADTLICADVRPLLSSRPSGLVAAVRDAQNPLVGEGIALPGWRELGIARGREYFNSGVMLIDTAECVRREVFDRARWLLRTKPHTTAFWDQDALNWAVQDRWERLDPRWNTFALSPLAQRPEFVHHAEAVNPLSTLIAQEETAAILHFAGPDKPWQEDYPPGLLREKYHRALHDLKGRL